MINFTHSQIVEKFKTGELSRNDGGAITEAMRELSGITDENVFGVLSYEAYSRGHAGGWEDVVIEFDNLVSLINDYEKAKLTK